ncbi:MAG: BLUF domain-containing protein [Roseivirga sp.]
MLFELIYRSEADASVSNDDVMQILNAARDFNRQNGFTGCLLYNNRQFVQVLEGEFNALNILYGKIRRDGRHKKVVTLHMQEIEERSYPDWTMAFKSLEDEDMRSIAQALGVRELRELQGEEDESQISKKLFSMVAQSIT